MDGAFSRAISRKRKRDQKQKMQSGRKGNTGIGNLGDDCIVNILSRMCMKEAARTSVLSRRWRYLWTSAFGTTLEFDNKPQESGLLVIRGGFGEWKKFKRLVNAGLVDHQQDRINGLIIRFLHHSRWMHKSSSTIESRISFAIRKEVRRFQLETPYNFPLTLLSDRSTPAAFRFLQLLTFRYVSIEDNVLRYFFESCPHLQELRLKSSPVTKVEFGDTLPNFKTLEISNCGMVHPLDLCAPNLVSFSHQGPINFALDQFPSLSELTLVEDSTISFIYQPHLHSSYSHRLEKLILQFSNRARVERIATPHGLPQLCSLKRLELQIFSIVGRSVLFFASLIKTSPLLREFRFEILYLNSPYSPVIEESPYPAIARWMQLRLSMKILIKVVEMVGYIGCSSDEEFLCHLFKIAPTLEMVVIDTHNDYYYNSIINALIHKARQQEKEEEEEHEEGETCLWDDWPEIGARTSIESKERASHFITSHNHITQHINFLVK